MNPLQKYQVPPISVSGNQFLAFKQPANFMTDQRPSSDLYAYLINNAVQGGGVTTGHQLRQYMQDNAGAIMSNLENNSMSKFHNLSTMGAPNTCSGYEGGIIYSHGRPLVDDSGNTESWINTCASFPNSECMMTWENTPMPQQGPHCEVPNKGNKYQVLS